MWKLLALLNKIVGAARQIQGFVLAPLERLLERLQDVALEVPHDLCELVREQQRLPHLDLLSTSIGFRLVLNVTEIVNYRVEPPEEVAGSAAEGAR